jgi:hypothetical protein
MSLVASILIYLLKPGFFASATSFAMSIVFLTVFPLLAYVVWYIVPTLRKGGRKTQRRTAVIFGLAGYLAAFIFSFIFKDSIQIKIYYLAYLISSITLFLGNITGGKFNPSGHAGGLMGPVTFLTIYISPWFAFGYLIVVLVGYISISMRRHTILEFIVGGLVPVLVIVISYFFI